MPRARTTLSRILPRRLSAVCWAVLFLAAGALPVRAAEDDAPIVISSTVDRREILIGDQIDYRVSVEWDPDRVDFQRIEPSGMLGVFEIVRFDKVEDGKAPRGRRRQVWGLTLSTFETGDFEIPPFGIRYKNPAGEEVEGRTQAIRIRVDSALDTAEASRDARPLKAPAAIAPDPKYRRRIIGLALACGALLGGAIWFVLWRRRRKTTGEEVWTPPRPIEEMAFEELEALAAEALAARGEIKAYYSRLSEILRVYLGRRLAVPAIDMTSFELLAVTDQRFAREATHATLEQFCGEADMAKFAKWPAPEERCSGSLEAVRLIVRETTPRSTEPVEEAGAKEGVA
jgi:hypothetical protein